MEIIHDATVLPALRELCSLHPAARTCGPETLARMLFVLCYLPYSPDVFAVEAALEALSLEGELAA